MYPYSLACLLQLPQLKQLTLAVDHDITADFWEPLLVFPQLQCLTVYPEQHALVSLDRDRFKKERPDLKIVLLKHFESLSTSAGSLL